jgi:SAM-dependent methyltransferase
VAEQERWQLDGDEPWRYERYKVPKLFGPLAERFIEHVGFKPGERVLDVACGTGIVARLVASRVGTPGKVVGIDLNAGMLAVARATTPQAGAAIDWRPGDAQALPFPAAAFDTVLCQQGLQFFLDRAGALREMHRVLVPDGRLAINVWGAQHAYLRALSASLSRHVGASAGARSLAPLGLSDAGALRSLVLEAGFRGAVVHSITIYRRIQNLHETLTVEIAGTPFAAEVCAASDAARAALVSDIGAALEVHRDEDGYAVPAEAHFLTAWAR